MAAIQEERITRVKNDFTFPVNAINALLTMFDLSIEKIDRFVFASNHLPFPRSKKEMLESYKDSEGRNIKILMKNYLRNTFVYRSYINKRRLKRIELAKNIGVSEERISFVEHHLCHAAAAYWGSPFDKGERTLILTADGGGDSLCATVSIGEHSEITRIAEVDWSNSIGSIYAKITYLLGMVPNEHEYKLMGMSPYGDANGAKEVYNKLKSWFYFEGEGITWRRKGYVPHSFYSYEFLRRELERMRFDWIARGLQEWMEDFLCQWVSNSIELTGIHNVVLGGGVFMNVKANKRISELNSVNRIFVFPSCGDETNSIGAAYSIFNNANPQINIESVTNVYWGPEYDDEFICKNISEFEFKHSKITFERKENIEEDVAELLSNGKIVARFYGREEFGARSLGNRAILANPCNTDSVQDINEMIKNRDFWMPFACSIKEDRADDYLINSKNISAPFMIFSFDTTDLYKDIMDGIHPYDKTVRPQIVEKSQNENYYKLIDEFEKRTGIGGVLNTSFNLHGFPIVSSPWDALDVLDRSGLQFLAIGNYLIAKN
jgi:carbamoyltransferase